MFAQSRDWRHITLVAFARTRRRRSGAVSKSKVKPNEPARGWLARWDAIPLYVRILVALVIGALTGLLLGERALVFEIPSKVILQLLGALAPPLILIAVTHVLMTTQISGRTAGRLSILLLLNTTVAIFIGLTVANLLRPGTWSELKKPEATATAKESGAMSPGQ